MLGAQVVANAANWPLNTVVYSQSGTNSPTGHRPDCSGFASMCLGLNAPGLSTVTLVRFLREIDPSELEPGDLIGRLGEGTEGDNGHVAVFLRGFESSGVTVVEQAIGTVGPDISNYKRIPDGFRCYRYTEIDGDDLTNEERQMLKDLHYYFFTDAGGRRTGTSGADLIKDIHFAMFEDAGEGRPDGSLASLPEAVKGE